MGLGKSDESGAKVIWLHLARPGHLRCEGCALRRLRAKVSSNLGQGRLRARLRSPPLMTACVADPWCGWITSTCLRAPP